MLGRRGIGRVGRPSLVGTAARTAVVAGTATAVAGKVHASQQAKAQAQAAPAAAPAEAMPPPAPDDSADPLSQLEKLANLYKQGILTAEEFTAKAVPILVP
jgi:Short C-terminal domain